MAGDKVFREFGNPIDYLAMVREMSDAFMVNEIILDEKGLPSDFRFLEVNQSFEQLSGRSMDRLIGKTALDVFPQTGHSWVKFFGEAAEKGGKVEFIDYFTELSKYLKVIAFGLGEGKFAVIMFDFSLYKEAEIEQDVTIKVLEILNSKSDLYEAMQAITGFLKDWLNFDAVAVRLRQDGDYPYFSTQGFPAEFVKAEKYLCEKDLDGQIIRDDVGNPYLECMCGNILCGRFNPEKPFFTLNGSFWSNGTTDLLASTTDSDRMARTRNRCNGEGYESVALIPLRSAGETFGLLQFNDFKKNRFTPGLVPLLERLSGNIAIALSQRMTLTELQESEGRYHSLFENMLDGFAYCRMLYDQADKPYDFIYLDVNSAFEKLTGLNNIVGKRVLEAIPGIKQSNQELFEIYGRVAKTGQAEKFEIDFKPLNKWLCVSVYSPQKDYFIAVFDDITERKCADAVLKESEEKYRLLAEKSNALICEVDEQARFLYVNSAFKDILGYDARDLIGRTVYEIGEPSVYGEAKVKFQEALKSELPQLNQWKFIDKSGKWHWLNCYSKTYVNSAGESRVNVVSFDVTRLKDTISEKDTLLRELYHRTKNNMQVIYAMLALYSGHEKEQHIKDVFKEMENRIRSMALVHEMLYQSKNLSSINLKDYIQDLIRLISDSYKAEFDRISVSQEIGNIEVTVDVAIPSGLIINELMLNCFKHAFPDGRNGEIMIQLNRNNNGMIELIVSDNGVGLPQGFDLKKSLRVGLKSICAIAEHQLGGKVDLETKDGKGLSFHLLFRDAIYKARI